MPSLYKFDDFENCSKTYRDKALYCIVKSYIRPDESSELYRFIENYSSNLKQRLRHDKLQRGMCINACEEVVHNAENGSHQYYQQKFPIDSKVSDNQLQ